ncbi:MAG: hypothetical protein ACRDOE_25410, partial [Streptosporangiaceae bacterium]
MIDPRGAAAALEQAGGALFCGGQHLADLRWGPWTLRLADPALCHPRGYPICLTRFTDSCELGFMVFQVAGKDWADAECLAGLVRALDAVLDPQGTLCTWAGDRQLTEEEILARVQRVAGAWPLTP